MTGIAQAPDRGLELAQFCRRQLRLQEGAGRRIELIVRLRRPLEELVEFLSCQTEVVASRLEGGPLDQLDRAGEDGSLFGRIAGSHGLRLSSRRTWKRHHTGPITAAGYIPVPITRVITARSQPQGNAQADQTGTQIDAATQT